MTDAEFRRWAGQSARRMLAVITVLVVLAGVGTALSVVFKPKPLAFECTPTGNGRVKCVQVSK